jgi:hypothetical protein
MGFGFYTTPFPGATMLHTQALGRRREGAQGGKLVEPDKELQSALEPLGQVVPVGLLDLQPLPPAANLLVYLVTRFKRLVQAIENSTEHRWGRPYLLAPNAALRKEVVASARPSAPSQVVPSRAPLQLPLFGELFNVGDDSEANGRRKPWAWLLRHVFAIDVTVCPKCAGTKTR